MDLRPEGAEARPATVVHRHRHLGTREPTEAGTQAGIYFAEKFAEQGFNIVSGLAIGCDSTGVITAVADAVTTVSDVLQGKTTAESLLSASKPLDEKAQKKEEKRLAKQMEEDFATAKEEVEAVLSYPPNNAIFGSSSMSWPWKVGLWVHNGFAHSKGKFGKWILKHFGTSPVLVSQVSPEMRVKVATNTLHNYGFFRGKVTYDILTQKNPKKARSSTSSSLSSILRFGVRSSSCARLRNTLWKKLSMVSIRKKL